MITEVQTAWGLMDARQFDAAEKLLARLPPNSPTAMNARAVLLIRTGRFAEATDVLREMVFPAGGLMMDSSTDPAWRANFCLALHLAGNHEGFVTYVQQLSPRDHPAVQVLTGALADWRKSVARLPILKRMFGPRPPVTLPSTTPVGWRDAIAQAWPAEAGIVAPPTPPADGSAPSPAEPAPAAPVWRTVRIFISSTFRDMHAERDELNSVVFPALAERLKPRRCRLEPIDLRVGIETEGSHTEREREQQILKVCLAEIERSRPFLLVLLGDRYGWVPGNDRIRVAATEAGFAPEDDGCSVTALEIEYGLLQKSPEQRRRCLLCLREPLPYSRMPPEKIADFCDAYATDAAAADRARRLRAVKEKIVADPELAGHRLAYSLGWDAARQQPASDGPDGIREWGRKVESALWRLLDEETGGTFVQEPPSWQEQERFMIEELVERLSGSFVGRGPIIRQALDLVTSPDACDAAWGLCMIGESGAGKTALFARLHREIQALGTHAAAISASSPVLLLSHAAGISPRSGQTEWMLRRWIAELAAATGDHADVPDHLAVVALEQLFARRLSQAATMRRVVVLVDALDQFIRTERARAVAWLPPVWPANARFIATSIPGEETERLGTRTGLRLAEVPPLEASEASAVALQVYGRYHRQPNDRVVRELLGLKRPDGGDAASNPLWLTLALDLLNQFDADDFTAAEASADGSPEEKLQRMVRDRARALPPGIDELYKSLLAHVEKVAGVAEGRAFAALIALSRHGWRDEDLEALLPVAAMVLRPSVSNAASASAYPGPGSHDPLRVAVLRRCFRAHMVKRGVLSQWDFAHASLRRAVLRSLQENWYVPVTATGRSSKGNSRRKQPAHATVARPDGGSLVRTLYQRGADYLESLPPTHAVREGELMWQMLGTRDVLRVARHCAAADCDSRMLALFLAEDEATDGHPLRKFVISLMKGGPPALRAEVADKLQREVNEVLSEEGHLLTRRDLLFGARDTFRQLTRHDGRHAPWWRGLRETCLRLHDVLLAQGDPAGAGAAMHEMSEATARKVQIEEQHIDFNADDDWFGTQTEIGELLKSDPGAMDRVFGDTARERGETAEAIDLYRKALVRTRALLAANPADEYSKHRLIETLISLGDALWDQGELSEALEPYREAEGFLRRVAADAPSNTVLRFNLGVVLGRVGAVLGANGDLAGARPLCVEALSLARQLTVEDPVNADYQRALGGSHEMVGDVLLAGEDLAGALSAYGESLVIRKRLVASDPSNVSWRCDLAVTLKNLSFASALMGKGAEAVRYLEENHALLRDMREQGVHMDERFNTFLEALDRAAGNHYADVIGSAPSEWNRGWLVRSAPRREGAQFQL